MPHGAGALDARIDALRARFAGHPPRPLDFVVYGVPRSGTTAVARYLNAHAGVLCLHERFDPETPHKGLTFPGSVFDAPWGGEANRKANLAGFLEGKRPPVRLWGAKTPRYYLRLPRVLAGTAEGKAVLCWRRPEEVAQSFTDRALNPNDHWRPQLLGLFGILEAPVCIARTLQAGGNVLTVPHRAVKTDQAGCAAAMLSHLAPGESFAPETEAMAEADRIGAARLSREKPPLEPVELEAATMIDAAGIHGILDAAEPRPFADTAAAARDWLAGLPPDLIRRGTEMAEAYGPGIAAFAREVWAPQVRPAWQDARRALKG